jgi:hypothetical protein
MDIDPILYKKMLLFYNAIEDGWDIKKNKETYVLRKKHEGKKEIFSNDYLLRFLKEKMDVNKI